ncbi:MAG: HlyD family efflux transporter periplasmic adaptor subunit [Alphaproteobacteria bacterium]|nr:HlyD family efflux transporter periplasmic adaptor subunit [Alphaproteobacteria bacterium]
MNRSLLIGIVGATLLGALVFAVQWTVYGRFIQKTDDAYLQADTIVISAKTPGRIAELDVADNAEVKAGDPLAHIERNDYEARLRQAEADRDAKQAAIETIEKQISLNDAKIADAKANVASAIADLNLRQAEYDRTAALSKQDFASKQSLDQRVNALQAAKARVESAKAALDAAKAAGAVLAAQRGEAGAALAAAEASLNLAEIDLENTVIRAPKDGVVGNVKIRAGEYAATGRQLMSLVPVRETYVVANFKETQVRRFRVGEKVRLDVDAYPHAEVVGVIDSLSPASGSEFSLLPPENATGNFTKIVQRLPVKIRIVKAPPDVALLPGLSVTAAVDTRTAPTKEAAIFAPRAEDEAVALANKP